MSRGTRSALEDDRFSGLEDLDRERFRELFPRIKAFEAALSTETAWDNSLPIVGNRRRSFSPEGPVIGGSSMVMLFARSSIVFVSYVISSASLSA